MPVRSIEANQCVMSPYPISMFKTVCLIFRRVSSNGFVATNASEKMCVYMSGA